MSTPTPDSVIHPWDVRASYGGFAPGRDTPAYFAITIGHFSVNGKLVADAYQAREDYLAEIEVRRTQLLESLSRGPEAMKVRELRDRKADAESKARDYLTQAGKLDATLHEADDPAKVSAQVGDLEAHATKYKRIANALVGPIGEAEAEYAKVVQDAVEALRQEMVTEVTALQQNALKGLEEAVVAHAATAEQCHEALTRLHRQPGLGLMSGALFQEAHPWVSPTPPPPAAKQPKQATA
jgi:hypothetical protein